MKDSAANVNRWLWTDARGAARTGVGKGEQRVLLRMDPWTDELRIQVTSGDPIAVAFHRPAPGKRHITGRLLSDGAPTRRHRRWWLAPGRFGWLFHLWRFNRRFNLMARSISPSMQTTYCCFSWIPSAAAVGLPT